MKTVKDYTVIILSVVLVSTGLLYAICLLFSKPTTLCKPQSSKVGIEAYQLPDTTGACG